MMMPNLSCFINGSRVFLNKSCPSKKPALIDGETYRLTGTVLLSVLIPVIVVGNTFVILAFATTRRLRSKTNHFVLSLAVADVLVGSLSLPIFTLAINKGHDWQQEHPLVTDVWTAVDMVSAIASIMNLMFISVDRFVCIQYPFRYHELPSKTRVRIMIVVGWLYGVLIYIVFRTTTKKQQPRPEVNLSITIMAFIIPLAVILFMYARVGKIALGHRARINAIEEPSDREKRNKGTLSLLAELKATRTLAVVVGAFVLCFVGYFVVLLYTPICLRWWTLRCKPLPTELVLATQWIKYFNSSLNPFIYAVMNGDMRRAMKRFVHGRLVSSESSFELN